MNSRRGFIKMLAAGLATIGIGKGPELEAKTVAVTLDPKELLWGTYGPTWCLVRENS